MLSGGIVAEYGGKFVMCIVTSEEVHITAEEVHITVMNLEVPQRLGHGLRPSFNKTVTSDAQNFY